MSQAVAIVEFYFDPTSPYCYLAATQMDRLAAGTGAVIRWYPLAVSELIEASRNPLAAPVASGQYDPAYRRRDVEDWASYYQVPYRATEGRLEADPHLLVCAAVAAGTSEQRGAMVKRLFAAVFVEHRTSLTTVDLFNFAADVNLDPWDFRDAMNDPMVEAERLSIVERAKTLGVFGVPFFVTAERRYFGNDRLVLLTHHLLEHPSV